ncbi:MAG: sulfurtransferase TusA [Gammaproteobacteria bacterium]|nr:MAG: sulfurtransferase TusA [Gammaproteobacteria bacterium]
MTTPIDSSELDSPAFDTLLDTSGLYCPEPVMMLHGAVRDVVSGQVIKVVATDPSTERDIPKFCQFLDHELIAHYQQDDTYIYFIRRG